jgi:thioredoxin reductase
VKKIILLILSFCCTNVFSHPSVKHVVTEDVDVIILGGGVAGLTSSIYLSRAGFVPYVVEGPVPGGSMIQASQIKNWSGEKNISGNDLMLKIYNHAKSLDSKIYPEKVVGVDFSTYPYEVTTVSMKNPSIKKIIRAKACIIAMGVKANNLDMGRREDVISIESTPNTACFEEQIDLTKDGYIIVDRGQRTSVEGVFAVGDITSERYKQAIIAAGDGAKAAVGVNDYLKKGSYKKTNKIMVQNRK